MLIQYGLWITEIKIFSMVSEQKTTTTKSQFQYEAKKLLIGLYKACVF